MKALREKFGNLTPAEARIAREAGDGPVVLGAEVPAAGDERRRVRAEALRWIILGKDPDVRVHEGGLRLAGALIEGTLDLEGCRIGRDLVLVRCRFEAAPVLRSATLDSLKLSGSELPGLSADGLEVRGSVFLSDATVRGEARLPGANLGGSLECDGATFERSDGVALSADGLEARGDVFLCDAKVRGEARLPGAKLGGDLDCNGATFERPDGYALNADRLDARGNVFLRDATVRGEARLLGAKLGGDLDCNGATFERPGGHALSAQASSVAGAFILRDGARIDGVLVLTAAELGLIVDNRACWPGTRNLRLNRCRYGAFVGGPVDAEARLDWLARQDPARLGEDFWPQPYEQCAKVLREMGHASDARAVLIEKERLQRRAVRDALRARLEGARLRLRVERMRPSEADAVNAEIEAAGERYAPGDPNLRRLTDEIEKARVLRDRRRPEPPGDPDDDLAKRLRAAADARSRDGAEPAVAARRGIVLLWLGLLFRTVWDHMLGAVVAYGRRPAQAFVWLAAFWFVGMVVFANAYARDAMKPNNAFVLRADEWVACATPHGDPVHDGATEKEGKGRNEGVSQLDCFLAQPEALGYPRFNAMIYSLDTLLPVVDVEMQQYWIPDETKPPTGVLARWYLWLHIGLGWALSLLAVAGFSGLVKSD